MDWHATRASCQFQQTPRGVPPPPTPPPHRDGDPDGSVGRNAAASRERKRLVARAAPAPRSVRARAVSRGALHRVGWQGSAYTVSGAGGQRRMVSLSTACVKGSELMSSVSGRCMAWAHSLGSARTASASTHLVDLVLQPLHHTGLVLGQQRQCKPAHARAPHGTQMRGPHRGANALASSRECDRSGVVARKEHG
jgi:hypothetical protein